MGMTADLNGEGGPDSSHGQDPNRDNPPLPADLVSTGSSEQDHPSDKERRRRRAGAATLVSLLVLLFAGTVGPILNQGAQNAYEAVVHHVSGIDEPIELSPICANLGGIVAPHAEAGAAYKWRCALSQQTITPSQIKQMCTTQWGPKARLILRDANSAAGWKCNIPG
jgi:hypothetical protein